MGNIRTGEVTTDEDIPANFDVSWEHIPRITNLVSLIDVDNAMEGAVQNIKILFKDRHVRNDAVNLQMLEGSINDIAFITGYLAGYYTQWRKAFLQAQNQDENHYYKIRVTTRAYFMKPTASLEGEDTYKVFDNERIINRFDPQGVPWGFTTPIQAYKMAAGACRRAISDTKTSQSGFRYHKMHSIKIAIYECKGLQAAGHDSDMEDEDEIMWEDEVPDGPAVIYQ